MLGCGSSACLRSDSLRAATALASAIAAASVHMASILSCSFAASPRRKYASCRGWSRGERRGERWSVAFRASVSGERERSSL
eukprot:3960464-Prymnesium_polylepis.1